jgi:predicted deacetylase
MTPSSARYLLRVDDLCPTVKREPWLRVAALTCELKLKPILAVVPDNRDPELRISSHDESFWERMGAMERAGAAIALHGYQHRAGSRGRSLARLHNESEFAGVSALTQRTWIRAGLEILRLHGLSPTLWVAPRHGFDSNTLEALRAEGISLLSDGFAQRPFLRGGFKWIPQQLWGPAKKRAGLWTICLHPNTMTEAQSAEFAAFAREHAAQFTSVDEALAEFPPSRLTFLEWLSENAAYAHFAGRRFMHESKRRLHRERNRAGAPGRPQQPGVRLPSGASQQATRDTKPHADRARPQD